MTTSTADDDLAHPAAAAGQASLTWWRLVAAAGVGVLLDLAFPPVGLAWLAPVAVAGFTLAVRGLTAGRAAVVGLVAGLGFFLPLLRWMLVIGPDAWLALVLLQATFLAGLGAAVALAQRLRGWPLWTAALWVGEEALRSRVPWGGLPWGELAFSQPSGPFTGLAAVGGAPAVSFAVALVGGLLAAAVVVAAGGSPDGRRRVRDSAVLLAAAGAVTACGLLVPRPVTGTATTAAVVQGNVPRLGLDFLGQRAAVLRNHVTATERLAAEVAAGRAARPALVVWPENSSDIDPLRDAGAATLIQQAVDAVAAPTLVGGITVNPADAGATLLNVGIVWQPASSGSPGPSATYVKRHPVPFGEYVPLRGLLTRFITRFDRVPKDFTGGDAPGVLPLGPARAGVVICFEVAYDELPRDAVRNGADLLVVQTNNATYGRTGQPEQQFAMARLRAVELGRTVLVAATSGISGVVAPDGRVVTQSQEFERWTWSGAVTLRSQQTLAARLGAWPEIILGTVGLGALLAAIAAARSPSRTRRERSPSP